MDLRAPAVRSWRTALVTGGIGRAIAQRFADDGEPAHLTARRVDELMSAAAEMGSEAVAVPCDVSDADGDVAEPEGRPEEITDVAAFLAGPPSSFVAGAEFDVDDGQNQIQPKGFR